MKLIAPRTVNEMFDFGDTTREDRIALGLLPPPLKINDRVRRFLYDECFLVARAYAAGATEDQVRTLVKKLTARRPKLKDALEV